MFETRSPFRLQQIRICYCTPSGIKRQQIAPYSIYEQEEKYCSYEIEVLAITEALKKIEYIFIEADLIL